MVSLVFFFVTNPEQEESLRVKTLFGANQKHGLEEERGLPPLYHSIAQARTLVCFDWDLLSLPFLPQRSEDKRNWTTCTQIQLRKQTFTVNLRHVEP